MAWADRVAIIGAGYMGQGIAQVLALAGSECVIADVSEERVAAAHEQLLTKTAKHVEDGLVPAGAVDVVRSRVQAAASVEDAVGSAGLVVEAVFEDREIKSDVLRRTCDAAAATTVIATNTSSISIEDLASDVDGPERFLGVHFFNPPQFVPGVEIIPCRATRDDIIRAVEELLRRAGKRPARVGDTPGFVANRLQYALFQEAAAVVEEGVATAEAVDEVVRNTFGFRLPFFGPFAIADMAGLDVYRSSYAVLEQAYTDGRFVAPTALLELIERGALGAKSGSGFVIKSAAQAEAMAERRDRSYVALGRLLEPATQSGIVPDSVIAPDDLDASVTRGSATVDKGRSRRAAATNRPDSIHREDQSHDEAGVTRRGGGISPSRP